MAAPSTVHVLEIEAHETSARHLACRRLVHLELSRLESVTLTSPLSFAIFYGRSKRCLLGAINYLVVTTDITVVFDSDVALFEGRLCLFFLGGCSVFDPDFLESLLGAFS